MHEPINENLLKYHYNGTVYKSKWAAVQAAALNGMQHTHIYDEILPVLGGQRNFFGDLDTTIEPSESWDDLCRERAIQLRESLPFVNIKFSGGHDSYLVLRSFLDNNLKVDRIVCNRYVDKIEGLNFEVDNVAIPILKSMDLKGAEVVISNWNDMDAWADLTLTAENYIDQNLELINNMANVVGKENSHRSANGQDLINGASHPRIYFNGKWRSHMWDSDNWMGDFSHPGQVPFFTTPFFPKLHLKQLHLVKNHFEKNKLHRLDEVAFLDKYRTEYIKAVRYKSPPLIGTSPFIVKSRKTYKNPYFETIKMHITKKKERFLKELINTDYTAFKTLSGIAHTQVAGEALILHKSFCRVYDVPLE